jgi:hypothetical protein
MKIPQIIKRIKYIEMLPPFYGIAWDDLCRAERICLPVPLNMIASAVRSFYYFIRGGYKRIAVDPRAAYYQGYSDGKLGKKVSTFKGG